MNTLTIEPAVHAGTNDALQAVGISRAWLVPSVQVGTGGAHARCLGVTVAAGG